MEEEDDGEGGPSPAAPGGGRCVYFFVYFLGRRWRWTDHESQQAKEAGGIRSLLLQTGWMKTRTKDDDGGGGGGGGIFHISPVLRCHGDRFHNTVTLEGARSDTRAFF